MIKQSDIELFNRVIDGLAGTEDHNELRTLLERDPAARQYFDSLVLAQNNLGKVERVAPPRDLKANVMASIATQKAPVATKTRHSIEFFASLKKQWKFSPSFNLALGTFAGAAAVILVVSIFSGANQLSRNDLSGTIGTSGSQQIFLTSGTVSAGHSSAQFDLTRTGKTLTVNILANPTDVAHVALSFDHSDLALTSVTAAGSAISPQSADNQIQFTATPGTAYRVTFEDRTAAVSTLKLDISDDRLSARQEISTGSAAQGE